jgi:uncharacterized Fe-S cluster protein YjdI/CDGSH-type Zn-finger protein
MAAEHVPVDERAADAGGDGAPPHPRAQNRAASGLTRVYAAPEIRVQWYASRCIHSAECIRALPQVFDPKRRPWIDVRGAEADAVADAILRCPTGALHFERLDGGSQEIAAREVTVEVVRDGPYYVRGDVEIQDERGVVIRHDSRVALCRCGQSLHMPFCDNTHRAIGFRDPLGNEADV